MSTHIYVHTHTVPALFITAENDDFISPSHAEQLYEVSLGTIDWWLGFVIHTVHAGTRLSACLDTHTNTQHYAGAKNLVLVEGDHNSQRQVNAHILILVLNLTATPTQTQHRPVFARGRGFLDEIYGTYHFSKNFFKTRKPLKHTI